MSDRSIRALFEGRLNTWATARTPALPVAWENLNFTPPAGTYLRAFVLRGDTTSKDLAGALRNRIGIFQINIVAAAGAGAGPAEAIAADLEALFPNNLQLTQGGFTVQVITPLRVRNGMPDDRYTLPVDLQYRADET